MTVVSLTILATRDGRTIRWKCVDLRELRERSELFLSWGYTLT